VIQQRKEGNLDFYKTWKDYKEGFGVLDNGKDFWIG